MAQQQKNITIAAPGFGGVNTEISPTEGVDTFASIADNCIIDRYGRIASRKGFASTTTDGSAYGGNFPIQAIHEFLAEDGTTIVFTAADNKIFKGEAVPVDDTPGGAVITANNWIPITFNNACYFLQKDHVAIQYDHATTITAEVAAIPQGNCGIAAYGRLWVSGVSGSESVVYWSDLLIGTDFAAGSSGSINVEEFWPRGQDEVVALAAHNGFLIIFGRESILVYSGADGDPVATLSLQDTVNGIGCIARDTVAPIGTDIYFLDSSGVRSFARTIQEKSLPIGDISANVKSSLVESIVSETNINLTRATYSPEESFYLLIFPSANSVACFNTKRLLPDGSAKATLWSNRFYQSVTYTTTGRTLFGGTSKVINYEGFSDEGSSFRMRYYSNPFSFGASSNLKFPKQVDFTLIAGSGGEATVYWAFDYSPSYRTKTITLSAVGIPSEYNIAEYNIAIYTGGTALERIKANVGGHGVVVTIGIETDIISAEVSIQQMDIQALLGRLV